MSVDEYIGIGLLYVLTSPSSGLVRLLCDWNVLCCNGIEYVDI